MPSQGDTPSFDRQVISGTETDEVTWSAVTFPFDREALENALGNREDKLSIFWFPLFEYLP